jgi:hypothetical protein
MLLFSELSLTNIKTSHIIQLAAKVLGSDDEKDIFSNLLNLLVWIIANHIRGRGQHAVCDRQTKGLSYESHFLHPL